MKTKLTVIVDNTPSKQLAGEWGLSILVEYGDKKILADVGASNLFATNLKELGFDIADIDAATLSHAHYDHSNGMKKFFDENRNAKFYLQETTAPNCYKKVLFIKKYIGIPNTIMTDYQDRIEIVSGDYKLFEGVYLIPHKTDGLEKLGKRENMYRKTQKGWELDNFSHEQSLVLDTDKGLVIINCCSHGGVVNIINEVKATFPDKRVYGVIGGFHLYNKTKEEVDFVGNELLKTGVEFVCTGHCTKDVAYEYLKDILGEKLCKLEVGLEMEF